MGRVLGGAGKAADPDEDAEPQAAPSETKERVVTAKRPNHVWHVDLTAVPTAAGLCCTWLPLALPQRWPFCYWAAVAIDHFSRRAMGVTAMKEQPTSTDVRAFLGRAVAKAKAAPKHIICDRGRQFDCEGFRNWCARKGIKPRYGAVGKHGSIAVVERFILTLKTLLRCLLLTPYRRTAFLRGTVHRGPMVQRVSATTWPGGRTPDEAYYGGEPKTAL